MPKGHHLYLIFSASEWRNIDVLPKNGNDLEYLGKTSGGDNAKRAPLSSCVTDATQEIVLANPPMESSTRFSCRTNRICCVRSNHTQHREKNAARR
jgi:hypothetical protein